MMIAFGPRALAATESAKLPRFFWDFNRARKSFAKHQPPYTAPISLWYQLDVALTMMRAEGRENIFARHAAIGEYTRRRVQEIGLTLFADPAHASNTVTAVYAPAGKELKPLLKALREEDRVVFAGGQDHLEGKIFRVGHLGAVQQPDIAAALDALERRLK